MTPTEPDVPEGATPERDEPDDHEGHDAAEVDEDAESDSADE